MEYERTPRVLLVEEDASAAATLERSLRQAHCRVQIAGGGAEAVNAIVDFRPDLVILDLAVSPLVEKTDPVEVTELDGDIPILTLSGAEGEEGDCQLIKPFTRKELLEKVRDLLQQHPPRVPEALTLGDLKLSPDTRSVTRAGKVIFDLTQREFELLEYLMRHPGETVSRQRLLDEVWAYDTGTVTNTIEVFVSHLRKKLEAGGESRLLHTIRGEGYVLDEEPPGG